MVDRDMWDMVLIEKGRFVALRLDGVETGFSSLAECFAYTGVDLSGKTYLAYEPEIFRFIDDAARIQVDFSNTENQALALSLFTAEMAKCQAAQNLLDHLLSQVPTIVAAKADPYWGLTEHQKNLAIIQGKLEASDAKFIRATEDLIDVLIAKGVIRVVDLPGILLERINERKELRKAFANS